jgi:hypothetical protein
LARALYRSGQVVHALWPRVKPDDLDFARRVLTDDLATLFLAMERRDQRHAIAVARRLQAQGVEDRDLLTAALLHDCGKGAVPVWLRVLKVLSPGLLQRLAQEQGSESRQAAYRLLNHAPIGAERVLAAGGSPTMARLISGRVEAGEEARLALLIAADDAS